MKRYIYILTVVLVSVFTGCSNNDLYEDMPRQIQTFINQYFPNSQLESFVSSDKSYRAIIKDGPGMTFNADCNWTSVNGYGEVLPQVLLYDQLPPDLYQYLQETENTHNVFSISRNSDFYSVVLLDYTLRYDIATGKITGGSEIAKIPSYR